MVSLTVRLDEVMKDRIEAAARSEDRSPTEFVIRAIKEKLNMQCQACGHSTGVAPILPYGLSEPFRAWLRECREKRELNPFYVTVAENGHNAVYWGRHRLGVEPIGSLPFDAYVGMGPRMTMDCFSMAIPFGVITGVGWDSGDGHEYVRLCAAGYVDGNEPLRRMVAARHLQHW